MLRAAVPVLRVTDSKAAEAFYCGGLGFIRTFAHRPDDAVDNPCYMGLVRDGVVLHLSSFADDGVSGGVTNLLLQDVDDMHEELLARGVAIHLAPTNQTWGVREMYVKDADGNSIRYQQL